MWSATSPMPHGGRGFASARRRRRSAPRRSAGRTRPVVGTHRSRRRSRPALLVEEPGHEAHHHDAGGVSHPAQHVVGHVARMPAQPARRRVREERRRARDIQRGVHRRVGHMGEIGDHPEAVALPYDLAPERRQPAHARLVRGAVRPRDVLEVGQGQVPRAKGVQRSQCSQRVVDAVPALHAEQRGDPAGAPGGLHVVGGVREDEIVGVAGRHATHGVDLLQRRGEGRQGRRRRRGVDAPEPRPHPAAPQPGDVGVQPRRGLVDGQVDRVQVVAHPRAQLPRQVIVAVDHRRARQHGLHALGDGRRGRGGVRRRHGGQPAPSSSSIMTRRS